MAQIKPRNSASPAVQNQSDGKRYWKISKGRAIERHPEEDRWALVRFIRVLARGLR